MLDAIPYPVHQAAACVLRDRIPHIRLLRALSALQDSTLLLKARARALTAHLDIIVILDPQNALHAPLERILLAMVPRLASHALLAITVPLVVLFSQLVPQVLSHRLASHRAHPVLLEPICPQMTLLARAASIVQLAISHLSREV